MNSSNPLQFELVLPCYNESQSLQALIQRAAQAAQEAGYGPSQFQLVLVENGSKDDSSAKMDELKQSPLGSWFRKVSVSPNQGYGHGIHQGLISTTAPWVGWSHADQQCDPADAFRALKMAQTSNTQTLVKGTRSGRNWKDQTVTRVFEGFALTLLGLKTDEINAQPKIFPRELLKKITNPPKNFAYDLYVLYQAQKAGYTVQTIEVLFPPRIHGMSNWSAHFFSRYKTILGMIRYMKDLAKTEGRL